MVMPITSQASLRLPFNLVSAFKVHAHSTNSAPPSKIIKINKIPRHFPSCTIFTTGNL